MDDYFNSCIALYSVVREAAIEEGIDEDLADEAYDKAIDRLMAQYGS